MSPSLKTDAPSRPVIKTGVKKIGVVERQKIDRPTGNLTTTNIGIKQTYQPRSKKVDGTTETVPSNSKEPFTFEALEQVWREYALTVKRLRKDSLYSTLTASKLSMSSDYQISLELMNSVQANDIDKEKGELLGFIRNKLKNYVVDLDYKIIEQEKIQVADSKSTFEKMVEENSSLDKFRKLFNLDIEF